MWSDVLYFHSTEHACRDIDPSLNTTHPALLGTANVIGELQNPHGSNYDPMSSKLKIHDYDLT